MRSLVAAVLVAALLAMSPVPAQAGAAADAALALAAFAVFNQLFLLPALARPVHTVPPLAVYTAPPAAYASAPSPAVRREVVYAHGRHVLLGDGVTTAYRWIWVPNPPSGPPPAPPR